MHFKFLDKFIKIPNITELHNRINSISEKGSIDKELLKSEIELRKIKGLLGDLKIRKSSLECKLNYKTNDKQELITLLKKLKGTNKTIKRLENYITALKIHINGLYLYRRQW